MVAHTLGVSILILAKQGTLAPTIYNSNRMKMSHLSQDICKEKSASQMAQFESYA